ncbi:MAG: ABC transporter ATP-binding protein, partial [Candidatus Kapabacteria bacterium]|nr:ABC transporter ATP-binding protein [Candidatus Kapabacteria bacterium]
MPQENIIQIINLTKRFNKFTAVDDLSLTVNKGGIFGFLGPNGAGKSTTIRMMLTLIEPSAGSIEFFGKKVSKTERNVFPKIGALVEKPDFYLYLSAYRNLEFFGSISGADVSKKSIMKMLETVGLADRAFSKVKTYSLGMKQRLGLAQALIHNPELIILDEPTNGLDPQGMKEVKDLLIHLANNEGKTIFLSSHILREVETMATSMAIINNGK